jgi:N-acetylglutamate synthase-like GNAT family acetyltransferase
VTVRPATADDIDAIHSLIRRCGLHDSALCYDDFTPPVFVAVDDDRVVGFVQALLGKPASVIMDMAVAPEYEHRGVGRALATALEDLMRSLGLTAWVTVVSNGRPRMQRGIEQWGALKRADARTYTRSLA